jgi:hypothetical protein
MTIPQFKTVANSRARTLAVRSSDSLVPGVFLTCAFILVLWLCLLPTSVQAQEIQDPTQQSNVIKETMAKIRDVEKLDSYISENTELKTQNKMLQEQLASLSKQVADLTLQLSQQRELLQRQLLQIPNFEVKSKIIGVGKETAVLQTGEKLIRIRNDTELSVPVSDGVWVLMKVEKISKDFIQLNFPEMSRTIYLYD